MCCYSLGTYFTISQISESLGTAHLWLHRMRSECMIATSRTLKQCRGFMANGKDLSNLIGGILLGILGGIVAAAIINALTAPKCPHCQGVVQRGVPRCPHCDIFLVWGD